MHKKGISYTLIVNDYFLDLTAASSMGSAAL